MATVTPAVLGQVTNGFWAALVLEDAGLPKTPNNINNILSWMRAEEPVNNWADRNNPLNNGLGSGGGAGLGSYANLSIAAAEVAQQLKSNAHGYPAIYQALANDASPTDFGNAVIHSDWADAGGSNGVPLTHYGYNPLTGAGYAAAIAKFTGPPPSGNIPASGSASQQSLTATGLGDAPLGQSLPGTCADKGQFFTIPHTSFGPTHCEAKAFTAGLLMVGGALVMGLGIVLLLGKSLNPKAAAKSAATTATAPTVDTTTDTGDQDAGQLAFAAGMEQGQKTNPTFQKSKADYQREREQSRRAGAPISKSKAA